MLTKRAKNKLYDAVHKTWVYSCMGITGVASAFIVFNLYYYFTNVRPIKNELEERFKEELLREGRTQTINAENTPEL